MATLNDGPNTYNRKNTTKVKQIDTNQRREHRNGEITSLSHFSSQGSSLKEELKSVREQLRNGLDDEESSPIGPNEDEPIIHKLSQSHSMKSPVNKIRHMDTPKKPLQLKMTKQLKKATAMSQDFTPLQRTFGFQKNDGETSPLAKSKVMALPTTEMQSTRKRNKIDMSQLLQAQLVEPSSYQVLETLKPHRSQKNLEQFRCESLKRREILHSVIESAEKTQTQIRNLSKTKERFLQQKTIEKTAKIKHLDYSCNLNNAVTPYSFSSKRAVDNSFDSGLVHKNVRSSRLEDFKHVVQP